MKFLLILETIAQVDEKWIIGLAEDKYQLFSLLFDLNVYFSFELSMNNFDINIYSLNDKNYNIINKILEKYTEKIFKLRIDLKVENVYDNFLMLPILKDSNKEEIIFNKKELDIIISIISTSKKYL